MRSNTRFNGGFTVLELLAALGVSAIVLGLGVPSYHSTIGRSCVSSGADQLLASLVQARSEAIARGNTVSICKSADGEHCLRGSAVSWDQGLLMFDDRDGNGVRGANETLIATSSATPACAAATTNVFTNYISFNAEGRANRNGSFFVASRHSPKIKRTVAVFTSRVRICDSSADSSCPTSP